MPTPYERVVRHESHGLRVCYPCAMQLPNEPCGNPACLCSCNEAEVIQVFHEPEDWGDRDAPEPAHGPALDHVRHEGNAVWTEPPARPEPIETWEGFGMLYIPTDIPKVNTTAEVKKPRHLQIAVLILVLNVIAIALALDAEWWEKAIVIVSALCAGALALLSVTDEKE